MHRANDDTSTLLGRAWMDASDMYTISTKETLKWMPMASVSHAVHIILCLCLCVSLRYAPLFCIILPGFYHIHDVKYSCLIQTVRWSN